MRTFLETATMAGLALLSVGLWTLRVALTSQGRRLAASTMAAVEATVFVVAFSRLLSGLDSPLRIAAYASGVAAGTAIALLADEALNPRLVRIDIVDPTGPDRVVEALSLGGWPSTVAAGHGLSGEVAIISVTTHESELRSITTAVAGARTGAFWTVSPVREAQSVPVQRSWAVSAPRPATIGRSRKVTTRGSARST